jgi:glutamate--cysteine ligase
MFRIGTEHEKFGFRHADLAPPPYLPANGQPGSIRDLLSGLVKFGGAVILDGDNPIGVKQGAASVSLEPAGQLELSGGPLETLHETKQEIETHFAQVRAACEGLDMGFAPLGFHPTATRAQMPWMPKGRYAIMRRYMPLVGSLGLDMMTRTCTVQVNLDFASEQDMRRKLRLSLLLQPLATALFANSPFTEGKPNGFLSYRGYVWTDTDNRRAGIPKVMFEDGFGFERYARWLIEEVPMYFVYRDGGYIDVAGQAFTDYIAGRVPALAGITATIGDFADHTTTAFTDVRLKRFLEMRGSDAGRADMMLAQSALWVGLLYDDAALTAAESLLCGASWEDAVTARSAVPRLGLSAPWRGGTLRDIAADVVAIARDGLGARGFRNAAGEDERGYLDPLQAIADGEPTQAEHWLARYNGVWNGDIGRIFAEASI